jgi:hypothetical protein
MPTFRRSDHGGEGSCVALVRFPLMEITAGEYGHCKYCVKASGPAGIGISTEL